MQLIDNIFSQTVLNRETVVDHYTSAATVPCIKSLGLSRGVKAAQNQTILACIHASIATERGSKAIHEMLAIAEAEYNTFNSVITHYKKKL